MKLDTALYTGYAVCENSTEDTKLLVIEGIIEECLLEFAGVVPHEKKKKMFINFFYEVTSFEED